MRDFDVISTTCRPPFYFVEKLQSVRLSGLPVILSWF